jgi:hypothetical protein
MIEEGGSVIAQTCGQDKGLLQVRAGCGPSLAGNKGALRSAITSVFGKDPTTYTIADLHDRKLNSKAAEGEYVRSFQMMARRLKGRLGIEKILVNKSGPLSD